MTLSGNAMVSSIPALSISVVQRAISSAIVLLESRQLAESDSASLGIALPI
jgi:hypothetical protein